MKPRNGLHKSKPGQAQNAMCRFSCPTCGAKRGVRCIGGRIHKRRRAK